MTDLPARLSGLLPPPNPALKWALAVLLVAVVASNAAWYLSRRRDVEQLRWLADWPATPAVTWLVVSAFLLLPPFAGWRAGAISPYYLGLSEIDWMQGLLAGAPLAALACLLSVVGWLAYRRTAPAAPRAASPVVPDWLAPLNAALAGWHQAFLRAGAIGWLAATGDQAIYWGTWLGLVLAAVEMLLNPFARAAMRQAGQMEPRVRRAVLAVAAAGLFALTRNLWLCLVLQVVVEAIAALWLPLPRVPARAHHH